MMNAPALKGPSALRPKQLHRCIASAATIFLLAGIAASAAGPIRSATAAAPSGTIVFASDRSGNYQIYSVHADGSRLGQLTRNHASDKAPRFSPDGRRIVFTRSTNCCGPGLWVMKANGSRQRRLAAYGSNPAWSPDSRRIAYVGLGKGAGNSEPLVIADIDSRRRFVVRGTTSNPVWSLDGRWIAFARQIGDRYDLMLVGRDGGRPRTLRRNGGAPLGWTRHGEVVTTTSRGIYLVRPEGRTARRLPAVRNAYAFALSPDGRRLAWVASNGRRLLIRALAGGRTRNITPRGTEYLDSPAWSANGRSVAVQSLPAGGVYDDILVVATNGTSSRRITQRVPYPYGRESQQPNWRPRGATRARLGRPPVAPLPSENVSRSGFGAVGGGTITSLAADGDRVAMVIDLPGCASVEVWDAQRARVFRLKQPCGPHNEGSGGSQEGTYGVALAGMRAAWIHTAGGNTLETYMDTATLARRSPVSLASGAADLGGAGTFAGAAFGDGALLAFTLDKRCDSDGDVNGRPEDQCPPGKKTGDVVAASVWRVGGQGRCPQQTPVGGCTRVAEAVAGDLTVLAVDAGRIATRTDTGVRLLTEQGAVLRDFGVKARAAALSGNRLAVRTATAVEIYDTGSGELLARMPVAGGVTLDDLEGDLLVTGSRDTVTVRRLADGRTTTFRPGGTARAQLEQPGLFVAGTRRVTFTPMSELLRRLGA
jgi:Tol biopolymer transport system component